MENESLILSTLQAMQRDVAEVKGKMATKDDVTSVRSEAAAGFASVRSEMATGFAEVRSEMATKTDLASVNKSVEELRIEQTTMFDFIKENGAMKRDVDEAKSEMMTHVDGLAAHNNKFDQELLMMRNRQDRLEARMA